MRPIQVHLIAAACVVLVPTTAGHADPGGFVSTAATDAAAAAAIAARLDAPLDDLALGLHADWMAAIDRLTEAKSRVGIWIDRDVPELLDRASAYLHVQLRDTLDAGAAWLAGVASQVPDDFFPVPDLTILVVEPVRGLESSGYGWRLDPINKSKKFHKGGDYQADRGTPVYAAGDGVVRFCGRQNGYGKVIYLDHGGGLMTRYAHLSSIDVHLDDVIESDTPIGKVGSTGRTTGAHLHFEVRIDGRAVDPVLALEIGAMQRTVPAELVRLAAMALHPEAQKQSVDAHDPPAGMKGKNRPERRGRTRRAKPTS